MARSYNYRKMVPISEVHAHVKEAFRKNVDPVWHAVAKTAAINGCAYTGFYGGNYSGAQGVTFLRPTRAPRGYYEVLKFIASKPAVRLCEILKHFNSSSMSITMCRLRDGGLIYPLGGHKGWKATELGQAYLVGAHKYLSKRTC